MACRNANRIPPLLYIDCSKFNYLYPNPAQNVVKITIGKNTSELKVNIYNTTGQMVLTSEHGARIDVSHLAIGVYL